MRKCESCGKICMDDKDLICSRCGAVALKKCSVNSRFDSEYKELCDEKYHYNEEMLETDNEYENYSENANKPSLKSFKTQNIKHKKPFLVLVVILLFYSVFVSVFDTFFESTDSSDYAEEMIAENTLYCRAYVAKSVSDDDGNLLALYLKPFKSTSPSIYNFEEFPRLDFTLSEYLGNTVEFEYDVSLNGRELVGAYEFQFEEPIEAEHIFLIEDVSIGYEDEDFSLKLPFDAFSYDEDGYITYYALTSKDENNGNVDFEEVDIDFDAFASGVEETIPLESEE